MIFSQKQEHSPHSLGIALFIFLFYINKLHYLITSKSYSRPKVNIQGASRIGYG